MAYRDDNLDSTSNKARNAADAALNRHDEPATTGDRVGEATGGLAGAATGAAIGSLGGPIGTIIGGIAGAVGGWWTGRAVSEAASSFSDEDDEYYRTHFESTRSGSLSGTERKKNVVDVRSDRSDLSYDRARPAYQLGSLASRNPEYQGRSFDEIEPHLQSGWTSSAASGEYGDWSNVRDYARDAYTRGVEQRMTLSEEQLALGKRQVSAGEVELRKTVETEHVRESVPVMREEVTVERRPISAGADLNADIGEDEIRVPLMAEEVVVEKRVVPKEEVVLKKHAVQEDKSVEADLRRERVVYDEDNVSSRADRTAASGFEDRATDSGLGDRLADKADDLKDRFDGNPRSKPGPDATDRRI